MKTLIVYFSKSGRTKKIAEGIAEISGGDLHEIKTEKEYPKNYFMTLIASKREFSNQECPSLIDNTIKDFESYERILIGFPIWFGTCPMAVISFLKKYDFNGKSIYPFCTSAAGGCTKAKNDIEKNCAGKVFDGLKANRVTKEKISEWLNETK